jgi:hypothetical protein
MFSVMVPVGPADADMRRLGYVLESLRRYERPSEIELILIDDGTSARLRADSGLGSGWARTEIIRTPLWTGRLPHETTAMTAGTISGVRAASLDADFLLKLDTDALIIGHFSDQLRDAFAADASLGIVGSYDRTCTGEIRDWSVWARQLRRVTRRWARRSPRKTSAARKLLASALANPAYEMAAHCLGGAYAVSTSLAHRRDLMHAEPWIGAGVSEDVVMGVLCGAAGLRMRSMTAIGEPFGLSHNALPGPPEWLVARGHSIVHAVKSSDAEVEANIRRAFRASTLRSSTFPSQGEERFGDIELRA